MFDKAVKPKITDAVKQVQIHIMKEISTKRRALTNVQVRAPLTQEENHFD